MTQVLDNGTNTLIDSNYWSDWTSPDINNDGIENIPCETGGSAGTRDEHARTAPYRYTTTPSFPTYATFFPVTYLALLVVGLCRTSRRCFTK